MILVNAHVEVGVLTDDVLVEVLSHSRPSGYPSYVQGAVYRQRPLNPKP